MSDASMGASEEGGTPMAHSPRSNDDVPAASGPNVAALGEALEPPLDFIDLKASMLSARKPSLSGFIRCMPCNPIQML